MESSEERMLRSRLDMKLWKAAGRGDYWEAKCLLEDGADARWPGAGGRTALMEAMGKAQAPLAQMLAGASDLGARDARGRTALHWAAAKGQKEGLECLCCEAAWEAADEAGMTPLGLASLEGRAEFAGLCECAARIFAPADALGQGALEICAVGGKAGAAMLERLCNRALALMASERAHCPCPWEAGIWLRGAQKAALAPAGAGCAALHRLCCALESRVLQGAGAMAGDSGAGRGRL